jgi:hypothetical protein
MEFGSISQVFQIRAIAMFLGKNDVPCKLKRLVNEQKIGCDQLRRVARLMSVSTRWSQTDLPDR